MSWIRSVPGPDISRKSVSRDIVNIFVYVRFRCCLFFSFFIRYMSFTCKCKCESAKVRKAQCVARILTELLLVDLFCNVTHCRFRISEFAVSIPSVAACVTPAHRYGWLSLSYLKLWHDEIRISHQRWQI